MAGPPPPSTERLLAIIELQNAIAAAALDADAVMRLVAERAALLTQAGSATVELVEGDDMVCRVAAGSTQQIGLRKGHKGSLSGRSVAQRQALRDPNSIA